jgi:outer membrane protein OmpA-like peptidoglycan-associated protein
MIDLNEAGDGMEQTAPVWAVFGDLMSGLLGAFVLILVGVLVVQMDLMASLESEVAKRRVEEQRRMALEKALAIPLASGRVTLANGRIGISGSVLFALNSDQLRPDGRQLLKSLVPPLQVYLGERDEMLMVSGFTDDKPITQGNRRFEDNLELSAQRALTVTRALIEEGMPSPRVFAAAFGAEQPVAANSDEQVARKTGGWKWRPWPVPPQRNPPLECDGLARRPPAAARTPGAPGPPGRPAQGRPAHRSCAPALSGRAVAAHRHRA